MFSFIKVFLVHRKRDITIGIIIFLIAIFSFGLGYLSNREFSRAPIVIEKCSDFISE